MGRTVLVSFGVLVAGACAGQEIVETDAAFWTVGPPILAVGEDEEAGENSLFNEIVGAVRLSDGRIVVGDGGSSQIRFFDESGRFLSVVGGEGDGPEEFRRVNTLELGAGDSLVVMHGYVGAETFSLVEPRGGGVVVRRRLGLSDFVGRCWSSHVRVDVLDGRSVLLRSDESRGPEGCGAIEEDRHRPLAALMVVHWWKGSADTVGFYAGSEQAAGGRAVVHGADFHMSGEAGRVWIGDSATRTLARVGLSGDTLVTATVPFSIDPVEAMEEGTASRGGGPGGERASRPTYPRFGRMLVGNGGDEIWVLEYPQLERPAAAHQMRDLRYHVALEMETTWAVFDDDGSLLARARLPARFGAPALRAPLRSRARSVLPSGPRPFRGVHKLFAARPRDLEDAAGAVRRKGPELDWSYLERWCREFALVPGRERMPELLEGLRREGG